jgi:diguanylate cyclase (GGDEF)-like protein
MEIARAHRDGTPLALASFDLDYFKRINDEWGHDTGDRVLTWLARLLTVEGRVIDTVARVGGEEFVVLLPETDADGARAFTERVRRALAFSHVDDLPEARVSAGTVAMRDPEDLPVLLQRADSALYAAKRAGRDRTMTWQRGCESRLATERAAAAA